MAEYIPGLNFQAAIEKCELCQEEDAQFYCKDCRQEMCSGCKRSHLRSKVSLKHNVVSSNLGKSNRKERKPIKCTSHPKEIIRMYCTNCDEAVCIKCISGTKHKKHNFDELEATLYRYQDEISQSITETQQQIAELEKSLQDIDVNVKDYTEVSDKTINEINKQRNQIKSDADKIADGLVNKVQKQKEQDLQLKEKEKKDVQKILHNHNEHLRSCEGTLNSMKNFTAIQPQIKTPKASLPSISCVSPPKFVINESLNLQEMFGHLVNASEDCTSVSAISTEIVTIINPGVSCAAASAVNEKEAWCGVLNDLVLTDIHGTIKRKIKLNGNLMDVAVTSKGEVFVTDCYDTNIKQYLTDGNCINISDTQPYQPRGLCVTSQDDLLVGLYKSDYDDDGSKVVRMTTTGHIKQTIQKCKQHWLLFLRQPLFTDPMFVTENINGDVVVVDRCSATIVVFNKKGEHRYRYPHSSQSSHTIAWCEGIACDNTGCILVSDHGNHRIHQLDINGRFIKFILTEQHGIQYQRRLSIDKKDQLWLCNDDKVIVFKYRS